MYICGVHTVYYHIPDFIDNLFNYYDKLVCFEDHILQFLQVVQEEALIREAYLVDNPTYGKV